VNPDSGGRWRVDRKMSKDPATDYDPHGTYGDTTDNPSGPASLYFRRFAKFKMCLYNGKDVPNEMKIFSGLRKRYAKDLPDRIH
jgi:hypothetical protein